MNNTQIKETQENWDLEIKPSANLFDFRLSELWTYKDLLFLFIRRDFIAQYRQTILGPLWHFLQPALTTIIYLIIFTKIARISTGGIPPLLFYLSGITIWNYFSISLIQTSNTFVANAAIFGKVYFPRLIVPISIVCSNFIRFVVQSVLLMSVVIYYHFNGYDFEISARIILFPIAVMLAAFLSLSFGVLFSSLTTKYRDVTVLMSFGIQLYMYATPIVYPFSRVANTPYEFLIRINPLTSIVEAFRYSLFGQGSYSIGGLLYAVVFTLVVLLIALISFHRVERTFMDTV